MMTTFNEVKGRNLQKLVQFVPVVARVHGGSHPEFHDVRRLFDEIMAKTKAADAELTPEFKQLREITDNYTVPADVCESYAAVYEMLAELDQAYQA